MMKAKDCIGRNVLATAASSGDEGTFNTVLATAVRELGITEVRDLFYHYVIPSTVDNVIFPWMCRCLSNPSTRHIYDVHRNDCGSFYRGNG